MFVVPNFPHLRTLEMVVKYRELEEVPQHPRPPGKWEQDPDVEPDQRFIPPPKYYLNGNFVKQGEIPRTNTSKNSFGERRVPRRGLAQVFPGEPDYLPLAKEQGLYWLLPGYPSRQGSGASLEENGLENGDASVQANGITPPQSDRSKSMNGYSPSRGSLSEPARPSPGLPNGTLEPIDMAVDTNE